MTPNSFSYSGFRPCASIYGLGSILFHWINCLNSLAPARHLHIIWAVKKILCFYAFIEQSYPVFERNEIKTW